jgi:hypothetical protein
VGEDGTPLVFVGHLAAALGARVMEPRVSLGLAVAAAFALDLAWPLLLFLGLEAVQVQPGDTAFTQLNFESYPWSHSLALVVVWSMAAGVVARTALHSSRAGVFVGALVLSHWLLDVVVHRPDLPLWPSGPRVGVGLWNSIPATIVVEGVAFAAALLLYLRATWARDAIGRWSLAALVVLVSFIWISQPWSPPPPSPTAVAAGAMALWLLPPWALWIDAHRRDRSSAGAHGGSTRRA